MKSNYISIRYIKKYIKLYSMGTSDVFYVQNEMYVLIQLLTNHTLDWRTVVVRFNNKCLSLERANR